MSAAAAKLRLRRIAPDIYRRVAEAHTAAEWTPTGILCECGHGPTPDHRNHRLDAFAEALAEVDRAPERPAPTGMEGGRVSAAYDAGYRAALRDTLDTVHLYEEQITAIHGLLERGPQ